MNDAKSYNVLAARLVDLIKNGTGLNQALRAVGLEKKDLPACAVKKPELKKMLKDKFRYDLDIGDYNIPRRAGDENAGVQTSGATISNDQIDINALRERASALGLKPHPQMGVKRLMAQIQAKEQEIADANNGAPSGNDDETLSATGDENAGVQTSGATISNDQIDINALRERASALGLKPHPQMGVKRLMAQIQAKEQEIADANNGAPSGNDDETLSATGDENAGVQTQDSAPAAGNAADDAKDSGK